MLCQFNLTNGVSNAPHYEIYIILLLNFPHFSTKEEKTGVCKFKSYKSEGGFFLSGGIEGKESRGGVLSVS